MQHTYRMSSYSRLCGTFLWSLKAHHISTWLITTSSKVLNRYIFLCYITITINYFFLTKSITQLKKKPVFDLSRACTRSVHVPDSVASTLSDKIRKFARLKTTPSTWTMKQLIFTSLCYDHDDNKKTFHYLLEMNSWAT